TPGSPPRSSRSCSGTPRTSTRCGGCCPRTPPPHRPRPRRHRLPRRPRARTRPSAGSAPPSGGPPPRRRRRRRPPRRRSPSSWRASARVRPSTWSPWEGCMTEVPAARTTPSPAPPAPAAALAKALAAEHAAVYAYGVVGARTDGRLRARARAGFDAHRARRDQLRSLIVRMGGSPAEPSPAYRLPFPVESAKDAARLAAHVEEGLITAYLELAAVNDPSLRRLAALAAQECATRAYGWRPETLQAFPGMPGQAGTTPGSPGPAE